MSTRSDEVLEKLLASVQSIDERLTRLESTLQPPPPRLLVNSHSPPVTTGESSPAEPTSSVHEDQPIRSSRAIRRVLSSSMVDQSPPSTKFKFAPKSYGTTSERDLLTAADASPTSSSRAFGSFRNTLRVNGSGSSRSTPLLPSEDGEEMPSVNMNRRSRTLDHVTSLQTTRNAWKSIRRGESIDVECTLVAVLDVLFLLLSTATSIFIILLWHPKAGYYAQTPPKPLVLFLALVEAFTFFWMWVRSFVRTRKGKWEIVDNVPAIRKHYLSTWFLVDLLYALPLEFLVWPLGNLWFDTLSLRHFLRFVRGFGLGQSVNPLLSTRYTFRFLSLCCTLILVAHIAASIFWSISSVEEHLSYVDSLYWAMATLTSTGYGDIPTPATNERVYAVFMMAMGIFVVSSFTAFATRYLTSRNPLDVENDRRKETMHAMMKAYRVPWAVQREVISCFSTVTDMYTDREFSGLTESLPSMLQKNLATYYHANLLHNSELFNMLSFELCVEFAQRMQKQVCAPLEYIVTQGDSASELYVMVNGVADFSRSISVNDEVILGSLKSGDTFGGQGVMEETHVRTYNVVAKTTVEVIVIGKAIFEAVLESHEARTPEDNTEFLKKIVEMEKNRSAL